MHVEWFRRYVASIRLFGNFKNVQQTETGLDVTNEKSFITSLQIGPCDVDLHVNKTSALSFTWIISVCLTIFSALSFIITQSASLVSTCSAKKSRSSFSRIVIPHAF